MCIDILRLTLYKIICYITKFFFSFFPIRNKVFFSCFSGKCYDDNPKYISEKLHELHPEYRQIWTRYPGSVFETPDYITVVDWGTPKMLYELSTSRVWVDSHLKRLWMPKRKGQYYIETWHGGIPLKKIEKDIEDELSYIEKKTEKYNSDIADLFISNSSFTTEMYRRAFWGYKGEIMECGYPRVDCYFDDTKKFGEKVKKYYNIDPQVNILLYAPTFRGQGVDTDTCIYKFDYLKVLKVLEESTGEQWCFLLRLHPVVKQFSKDVLPDNDQVIDASNYDDMQELILAADMLLTDYSSCIFDFALLKRVGVLYTPDLDEYTRDRGLYFDLNSLPFPLVKSEKEMLEFMGSLNEFNMYDYQDDLDRFFKNIGLIKKSDSSEKVCNRIYKVLINEEKNRG